MALFSDTCCRRADWHWAWQYTHGRQVVNPMPLMMEGIVRLRANGSTPTVGVGAYSEGVNDDLNKAVWSGIAANPSTHIEELVAQYSRYHFGADMEEPMSKLLFGLEQNWLGGDIASNTHVLSTLSVASGVLEKLNGTWGTDWRMQMYLYRAYCESRPPCPPLQLCRNRGRTPEHPCLLPPPPRAPTFSGTLLTLRSIYCRRRLRASSLQAGVAG